MGLCMIPDQGNLASDRAWQIELSGTHTPEC